MAKNVRFNPNVEVIGTGQVIESLEIQAEAEELSSTVSKDVSDDFPKVEDKYIEHHERFRCFWRLNDLDLFNYLEALVADAERVGGQVAKNSKLLGKFKCGLAINRLTEWSVKLKFVQKNDEKYISIGLNLEQMLWNDEGLLDPNFDVFYTVRLIGKKQRYVEAESSPELTFGSDVAFFRKFKFSDFVSYETLLKNKTILQSPAARLDIVLDMYAIELREEVLSKSELFCKTHENLNKHYGDSWRAKRPDVKIKVGSQTFLTHQGLLEARSTIFANLLKRAKENCCKTCNIMLELELEDIGCEVVKPLLEYLYFERIQPGLELEKLKQMFQIGQNYKICSLKKDILASLDEFCTKENVGDVLRFAEAQNAPVDVRIRIIDFCEQNLDEFFQEVVHHRDYRGPAKSA